MGSCKLKYRDEASVQPLLPLPVRADVLRDPHFHCAKPGDRADHSLQNRIGHIREVATIFLALLGPVLERDKANALWLQSAPKPLCDTGQVGPRHVQQRRTRPDPVEALDPSHVTERHALHWKAREL